MNNHNSRVNLTGTMNDEVEFAGSVWEKDFRGEDQSKSILNNENRG